MTCSQLYTPAPSSSHSSSSQNTGAPPLFSSPCCARKGEPPPPQSGSLGAELLLWPGKEVVAAVPCPASWLAPSPLGRASWLQAAAAMSRSSPCAAHRCPGQPQQQHHATLVSCRDRPGHKSSLRCPCPLWVQALGLHCGHCCRRCSCSPAPAAGAALSRRAGAAAARGVVPTGEQLEALKVT